MAAQIEVSDVTAHIQSMGYTCDQGTITCIISVINGKDSCFDSNNYPDCNVKLIKTYLSSLMCISGGARKVQSERDLSGDAVTFDNAVQSESQVASIIRTLDTNGCVNDLIPATKGAYFRSIGNKLSRSN